MAAPGLLSVYKGNASDVKALLVALASTDVIHSICIKAMAAGFFVVSVGHVSGGGGGQNVDLFAGDFTTVITGIDGVVSATAEFMLDTDVLSFGPIGSITGGDGSYMAAVVVWA